MLLHPDLDHPAQEARPRHHPRADRGRARQMVQGGALAPAEADHLRQERVQVGEEEALGSGPPRRGAMVAGADGGGVRLAGGHREGSSGEELPRTLTPADVARLLFIAEKHRVVPGRRLALPTDEVTLALLWWVALTVQRTHAAAVVRKAKVIDYVAEDGWYDVYVAPGRHEVGAAPRPADPARGLPPDHRPGARGARQARERLGLPVAAGQGPRQGQPFGPTRRRHHPQLAAAAAAREG